MSDVLANLRGLGVTYRGDGKPFAALRDVDLDIVAGERLAVIGESGSGKTTLGLALAGILPDTAAIQGELTWPGFDGASELRSATQGGGRVAGECAIPQPGRDIGFVFQDPGASLNPVLSIGEQIAEVARRHLGLGWREAYGHALDLLARVHIPQPQAALRAYPHQLSGGQRQRVAIAAAIAARPKLLIADEPTSALDMIVQAEIVALLDALVRDDGMTLLFITHDIALASGFADRVAVFHDARLVESGRTADVLSRPKKVYTRHLIASHVDLAAPPLIAEAGQ